MGKRGPPPKPVRMKALEGTLRKDRDGAAAVQSPLPELPADAPACPASLAEGAKRVWHDVVPALLKIGTLASTDTTILTGYCTLRARAQALDDIASAEPLVETKSGKKANPAGVEARKLWPLVEKLATDLGLTYAAKARAGAPSTPQDAAARERRDQAERFIFGREPFQVIEGGRK